MDRGDHNHNHLSVRSAHRICELALRLMCDHPEVRRPEHLIRHHIVMEELSEKFAEMEDGERGMPLEQLVGFVLSLSEIVDRADDNNEPVDTNRYVSQCDAILYAIEN